MFFALFVMNWNIIISFFTEGVLEPNVSLLVFIANSALKYCIYEIEHL